MNIPVAVFLNSIDEADVARKAVEAYRAGLPFSLNGDIQGQSVATGLVKRLVEALSYPDNDGVKTAVLKVLFEAPEQEWVAYPAMVEGVAQRVKISQEEAARRTPAAIRDLSWQVKQKVDLSDLSGKQKAIEVLAERIRSGGSFSYRLTHAGQSAVEIWLLA
ncbi:hypothetical protein N181_01780 [Sinorhizobium fredii USDA 205]|uniref:Uncharacterized protein n=1 Tax=Rhizobium fredii TaxID=380 RepID=A0A844AJS4_RHIFR|nr:hypothetical protein [Sinorhizobium fredii]KSV87357.1 hypothetical protein N181_01780 [Sinorhizobium fredii USDA 205]MQX11796.1 hypothetical protein [Sinorhizobium fredii]GEC31698.1 hypothetical protein EFR01_18690 [Sinorhizobium fredii]GLS09021.1 hypothetical protein GCM10007864_26510 [Sinorhizobium fredii]